MCGIVGCVGKRPAVPIILSGLKRLEYRGYDSAGVAAYCKGRLERIRTDGKIAYLADRVSEKASEAMRQSGLSIGHTRWATHGAPTERNAHPHFSADGSIAVVHNGIIDNYRDLKSRLTSEGYAFSSDTDSEVLAHLIHACYEGDLNAAVTTALHRVEGTYGMAVISACHPGLLIAARHGSPIVVGVCEDSTLVASDVSALVGHTSRVIFLEDGDVLRAEEDRCEVTSLNNLPVARMPTEIDWDVGAVEKCGFEHFMLKEIHEQPEALRNTLRGRLLPDEGTVKLSGTNFNPYELAHMERVCIAACGTSLYAGMVGAAYFEGLAGLPAQVEQAAEFRYRNPIVEKNSCLLAVSQSGETADTLAAVREGMRKGATVLAICNMVGSTIARAVGRGVYLHAGPEIGVASTKAFTSQVAVLAMMAIAFGRSRRLSHTEGTACVRALQALPDIAAGVLEQEAAIRKAAERLAEAEHCFYIGRGYMYPAALEGALKLKEISYVHAEGYHAAELKHGPIALLDESVPVIAAVPRTADQGRTLANMQECRARKAPVIAVTTEGDEAVEEHAETCIRIPDCPEFLNPIPVVIAEQLLAYHTARLKGCEIDQPRNLAKSVTVE